jgi:hypothetical protein
VLECLLLHLLKDRKLDLTQIPPKGATIILHSGTPEKAGFLSSDQIHADIRDRILPDDTANELRRRNTSATSLPVAYDSAKASYSNLKFAAGIVVTDLTGVWQYRRRSLNSLYQRSHAYLRKGTALPPMPRAFRNCTRKHVAGWRPICPDIRRTEVAPLYALMSGQALTAPRSPLYWKGVETSGL